MSRKQDFLDECEHEALNCQWAFDSKKANTLVSLIKNSDKNKQEFIKWLEKELAGINYSNMYERGYRIGLRCAIDKAKEML